MGGPSLDVVRSFIPPGHVMLQDVLSPQTVGSHTGFGSDPGVWGVEPAPPQVRRPGAVLGSCHPAGPSVRGLGGLERFLDLFHLDTVDIVQFF